jgi:hypothetical protein
MNLRHLFIATALVLGGCGSTFEASTPPGFVEIENDYDAYDWRVTSADGLVMGVRVIDHDPIGTPEFWLKAIQNSMRLRGGYALLETVKVKSGDPVPVEGTQLRFGHDEESGTPHLYYLTLFVTPDYLFLVEAGGTKQLMTDHAAEIAASIAAFHTE